MNVCLCVNAFVIMGLLFSICSLLQNQLAACTKALESSEELLETANQTLQGAENHDFNQVTNLIYWWFLLKRKGKCRALQRECKWRIGINMQMTPPFTCMLDLNAFLHVPE